MVTCFDREPSENVHSGRSAVKTTVTIDNALLERAEELTGITNKTDLAREGLRALIERESARKLARLGGSQPQLHPIPRRRSAKA